MTTKQRDEITTLLDEIRVESFTPEYRMKATQEECMGLLVSKFFEWDTRIIKACEEALEDANFHSEAEALNTAYQVREEQIEAASKQN